MIFAYYLNLSVRTLKTTAPIASTLYLTGVAWPVWATFNPFSVRKTTKNAIKVYFDPAEKR